MILDSFQNVFNETSNYKIKLVQGSHIVTNKLYEGSHAYILQQLDRRIVFIIPYLEKYSLIGTTELEVDSPFNPQITPEKNGGFDTAVRYAPLKWAVYFENDGQIRHVQYFRGNLQTISTCRKRRSNLTCGARFTQTNALGSQLNGSVHLDPAGIILDGGIKPVGWSFDSPMHCRHRRKIRRSSST